MENPNFKNASIQYAKFVQSSSHTEMKAIFDTFIPFILFKECLDKKEKNEQQQLLDETKKNDANTKIVLKDLLKSNANTKKKYNKYSKNEDLENSDEESTKSDDPFDLTRDYEKVFNYNLITDEEKDEFRKGKPFPYLNTSLINLINKRIIEMNIIPTFQRPDEFHFQLLAFNFKDSTLIKCPKVSFQQNAPLFGNFQSPQMTKPFAYNNNLGENSHENLSNSVQKSSMSKQNTMKMKNFSGKAVNNYYKKMNKSKSQKIENINFEANNSFNSSLDDEENKIKDNAGGKIDEESNNFDNYSIAKESDAGSMMRDRNKSENVLKYKSNFKKFASVSKILQKEKVLKPNFLFKTPEGNDNKFVQCDLELIKDSSVRTTLSMHSLGENIFERGNKIAIPSDDLRKEIFIFDPINIDMAKGNISNFFFEEALKKRAKLLFPYRQNFIKIIIIKLLQFLFIIKSKIANKKSLKVSNMQTTNGKMKLKEIRGSNIITFSDVKPFMKSKFGHFNLDVFKEAYEKKIQKNEEIKRTKKLEELQKKFLDILKKDEMDRPDYEEDDNMRNERRRNDANPLDIEKDAKMLLGAVYKPRKKMNYLNGLKMLIREEAKKNKGNNYK